MINFININPVYSGIYKITRSYYESLEDKNIEAKWINIRFDARHNFSEFINPPLYHFTQLVGNGYFLNQLVNRFLKLNTGNIFSILTSPDIYVSNVKNVLYVIHDFFPVDDELSEERTEKVRIIDKIGTKNVFNYILRNDIPVITPSIFVANIARNKGYNVITPLYYKKRMSEIKRVRETVKTILSIGSNDQRKRPDLVIDFLNSLPAEYTFIRVGGDLSTLHGKEIKPKCKFEYYHNLSEDQLDALYNRADILFFPSEKEGLGLPIIEALIHRIPVLINSKLETAKELDYGMGTFIYFEDVNDIDLETVYDKRPDFDGWYKKYSEISEGQLNNLVDFIKGR